VKDCVNDCLEALRFPRQPNNRPGLSHIDYRIGTYSDIREALLRNLDKTPGLSEWTHRGADDPGIALLEGASILGDILTFYQELYANEAYLRTAQQRNSIADLVRLLGYHLSPGLGGNANFAFEIKGDAPVVVPAHFPVKAQLQDHEKPSDFETTAEVTAYPWLSKFNLYRSLSTPNISNQTQELYIFAPDQFVSPVELKAGDRLVLGEAANPANPTSLDNAEVVIIDSIRELHGRKLYKIKGAMKRNVGIFELTAFKLGRTFHHFGYNGPRTFTKPPTSVSATSTSSKASGVTTTTTTSTLIPEKNTSFSRWLDFRTSSYDPSWPITPGITPSARILIPSLSKYDFPLDAEHSDLATGTRLVIQAKVYNEYNTDQFKDFTHVRTINAIRSTSITWGSVTSPTSVVTIDEQMLVVEGPSRYSLADIREFLIHEVASPPLQVRGGLQETNLVTGNELYFFGTESQAKSLTNRALLLVKPGTDSLAAKVANVQALASAPATRPLLRRITLDRNIGYADFPNEKPVVTVYGNLVVATEGKTEAPAALGNGDNRQVFQTFKLPKAPLTYLISESATPPEVPELQIYVNNRLWKRVSSFFGHKPQEEIYLVREDADGNSWVQFGDGKIGARLPSGIKNVVARFRTGTGAFGPLKADAKAQAGGRLDRLDKIQMPSFASGGSQPEDGENARQAAPGKIQSLDRLVSLKDFESEVLGMAGVVKAAASWELVDNIPQVVLDVLMDTGRDAEIEKVRATLAEYNRGRGPNRFPVSVPLEGRRKYVVINATYGFDATYLKEEIEKAIQVALGVSSGKPNTPDDQSGLFSLRRRNFGQREYATSIAGTIQHVAGVIWAQVTRFEPLGTLNDPTIFAPPSLPGLAQPAVDCEPQNVLSLYNGHLQLAGVAETVREGELR
jgi:hypothetical protein